MNRGLFATSRSALGLPVAAIAAALWAVALLSACGQVQVQEPTVAATDATGDGQGNAGADTTATDTEAVDVAPKAECLTDFDCAGMKGKTPCNVPKCDLGAGKCFLKPRGVGEACTNPLDEAGECEVATCDDKAQCVKKSKDDGTKCGLTTCGKKCSTGKCVSAGPEDYDDKNPCTTDYCDQGKEVKHDPITNVDAKCDDGSKCTESDICVSGKCAGTPVVCTDNIACTEDKCTTDKGCVFTPIKDFCVDNDPCVQIGCDLAEGCTATGNEINKCDDGNPCTGPDVCKDGKCAGNPVTSGACGCATDADCAKNNTNCGGKFMCNKAKACELVPSTVVKCPSSLDICSVSTCDEASGSCIIKSQNDGQTCQKGDACLTETKCAAGACTGSTVNCDDKNDCTLDTCDTQTGCAHTVTVAKCSDGQNCTVDDACSAAGVCVGTKKGCDDGLPCTYDGCEEATGNCTHGPQDGSCDDKNPCTKDSCDATAGCKATPDDSAKCDDGNACTTDSCSGGVCKSVNTCQCTTNADCDDKNPCTTDTCSANKCSYALAPATQTCDVANKCVQPGTGSCVNGACSGGKPVDCSAQVDACNNAQCNPTTGQCEKVSKSDGTGCDADGNGCTVGDVCKGGKCTSGPTANCPAVQCNDVSCKSISPKEYACDAKPQAKGAPCDDGKFCNTGDACDGLGKCATTPLICPNQPGTPGANTCQPYVCDEAAQGCIIKVKPAGEPCEDGKYCTTNDTCNTAGQCIGGQPPLCKQSGLACSTSICDETINGCSVIKIPECCTSNADCASAWTCLKPVCDMTVGKCAYSQDLMCCDQNVFLNDFETQQTKGMTINNSAGPKQGWQFAAVPLPCPPNGPGCDPMAGNVPGKYFLYYGDTKAWNFDFGATSGDIYLPWQKIPKAYSWASLKFNLYMATEMGATYDKLWVELQAAAPKGGVAPPPILVWSKDDKMTINQWHYMSLDLFPMMTQMQPGQSYQVVIHFNTTDAIGNQGLGVFLDSLIQQVGYTVGYGYCPP